MKLHYDIYIIGLHLCTYIYIHTYTDLRKKSCITTLGFDLNNRPCTLGSRDTTNKL